KHPRLDAGYQDRRADVGSNLDVDLPMRPRLGLAVVVPALGNPHDGSEGVVTSRPSRLLVSRVVAVSPVSPTTDVRLVGLHDPRKWGVAVLVQHGTNLVEHAPCGLVGHPKLSLQLLCGDTAPSAGHEVDVVEPELE